MKFGDELGLTGPSSRFIPLLGEYPFITAQNRGSLEGKVMLK